ncbi:hypothetical protein Vafri_16688 [Volvox africanus]|uniref:Uncharacterized protein n=1 Tax=Volvox africanus TaxID=51714 RepID=A0A8J4BIN8_9CHLO|nr:hypothetical protein Vafri_16688 [Volvox africanus]
MDSDGCDDITRKPSIGREGRHVHEAALGGLGRAPPALHNGTQLASFIPEGLRTATPRSAAVDTTSTPPPNAPSQASAIPTTTGLFSSGSRRPNHRHKHTLSAASSVFDESDESSEEQNLARRSARMHPRIAPAAKAAPQATAPVTAATAAAANDSSDRPTALLPPLPPLPPPPPPPSHRGLTPTAGLTAAPSDTSSVVTATTTTAAAAGTATPDSTLSLLQLVQVMLQQQLVLEKQQQLLLAKHALTGYQGPNQSSVSPEQQQLLIQQQQQLLVMLQQQMGSTSASTDSAKAAAVTGTAGTASVGQLSAAQLPPSLLGSASFTSTTAEPVGGDINVALPQPQSSQPPQEMLFEKYLRQWSEVRPISSVPSATATAAAVAAGASPSTPTAPAGGSQMSTPAAASAGFVGLTAGAPSSYILMDARQSPATTTSAAPSVSGRTAAAARMPASAVTSMQDALLPSSSLAGPVPNAETVAGGSVAVAPPAEVTLQSSQLTVSLSALPSTSPTPMPELLGRTVRSPLVPPLQLRNVDPVVPSDAPTAASSRLQDQPLSTAAAPSAQAVSMAVAIAPTPPPLQVAQSPQRHTDGEAVGEAVGEAEPVTLTARGGDEVERPGVDVRTTEGTSGLDDKDKEKRKDLPSDELVAENLAGNIDAIAIFEQDEVRTSTSLITFYNCLST